jgi:hypothetical protein
VVKIGEYPQCRPQLRPTPHRIRQCPMSPCIEATPDRITRMAVTVAAVAHRLPRTSAIIDRNPATISALPFLPAIQHKALVMTTWSFPSARCTKPQRFNSAHENDNIGSHTHGWRKEFMDAGVTQQSASIEASAATIQLCFLSRLQRRFGKSKFPPISLMCTCHSLSFLLQILSVPPHILRAHVPLHKIQLYQYQVMITRIKNDPYTH